MHATRADMVSIIRGMVNLADGGPDVTRMCGFFVADAARPNNAMFPVVCALSKRRRTRETAQLAQDSRGSAPQVAGDQGLQR